MKRNVKSFFVTFIASVLFFLITFPFIEALNILGRYIIELLGNGTDYYSISIFIFVILNFIILTVVVPLFRVEKESKMVWIISSLISSILVPVIYLGANYLYTLWTFIRHG